MTNHVGMTGVTVSRLNPSGMVRVNGRELAATTREGPLESGIGVRVIDENQFGIVVIRE